MANISAAKAIFRPFWLIFRPAYRTLPNMIEQTEELGELSRFYRLVQEVTARLVGARGAGDRWRSRVEARWSRRRRPIRARF